MLNLILFAILHLKIRTRIPDIIQEKKSNNRIIPGWILFNSLITLQYSWNNTNHQRMQLKLHHHWSVLLFFISKMKCFLWLFLVFISFIIFISILCVKNYTIMKCFFLDFGSIYFKESLFRAYYRSIKRSNINNY